MIDRAYWHPVGGRMYFDSSKSFLFRETGQSWTTCRRERNLLGSRAAWRILTVIIALIINPLSVRANDWSQIYFGGGVSVDGVTRDANLIVPGSVSGFGGNLDLNFGLDGVAGGSVSGHVLAGGDYQVNNLFVIGAYSSYSWSNFNPTLSINAGRLPFSVNLLNPENNWLVAGRVGVLVSPYTLLFGSLGYSWMEFDTVNLEAQGLGGPFSAVLDFGTFEGTTVGFGMESRVAKNVAVRAEYKHTDYGSEMTLGKNSGQVRETVEPVLDTLSLAAVISLNGLGPANGDSNDIQSFLGNPVSNKWTQFYLGGGLGADLISGDQVVSFNGPTLGTTNTIYKDDPAGGNFGGGIVAGADIQLTNRIVAGLFGSYDWAGDGVSLTAELNGFGQVLSLALPSLDNYWTVGGRVGLLAAPSVLLYGLGGYAEAEINDQSIVLDPNGIFGLGQAQGEFVLTLPSLAGYVVGGGAEVKITDNISFRGEYRKLELGTQSTRSARSTGDFIDLTVDPTIHTGRIALTFRHDFGLAQ